MRIVLVGIVALLVFFSTENQFQASATSTENNYDKEMRTKLLQAEKTQAELFRAVEKNLIVAGKTESQLADEVTKMAFDKFGVKDHWHKKIVRTGKNTMATYNENPADLVIQKDDILFVDYGIILDGYEADFARTYVLGNDPKKIKLQKDVEKAWYETQAWYKKQTKLTGADFYAYIVNKAKEYGYTYGGIIAGHIVGKYPHEQPANRQSFDLDVHPDNPNDMFQLDANGNKRHWILEMHFVDKENNMAAYMEQLL